MRSQRAIQSTAGSSSTAWERSAPASLLLAVLELPHQHMGVIDNGADVRLTAPDVIHDAIADRGVFRRGIPLRMAPPATAPAELVEREPQWKVCPPSITIVCPVTKLEPGPDR